jgi:hypothetical protein
LPRTTTLGSRIDECGEAFSDTFMQPSAPISG